MSSRPKYYNGPSMRVRYNLRDLFTVTLQVAVALSVVASVVKVGIIEYSSGGWGIGPPAGWLLYGLPVHLYSYHAIAVGVSFVACAVFVARSPRCKHLPRLWLGWLVVITLVLFFVVALVFRPPIVY